MPKNITPPTSANAPDWETLGRFYAGECSDVEAAQISQWLAAHPEDAEVVSGVNAAADVMVAGASAPIDVEAALQKARQRRGEQTPLASGDERVVALPTRPRRQPLYIGIAALLVVAIGLFTWRNQSAVNSEPFQRTAAAATVDSLTLPDGTTVLLGPGSTIEYAANYGDGAREVSLNGDGLFTVVRNDSMPFTVSAGNATVVDLSTAFAVRTDGANGVFVIVTEGRVRFGATSRANELIELSQGESASLSSSHDLARDSVGADEALAWTRGALVLRNTPLPDVQRLFARWFGISLTIDSALASRRVTAEFVNESPATVLRVLALSLGAEHSLRADSASLRAASSPAR